MRALLRLDVLEGLHPDLLVPFLAPHLEYLAAHGIDLAHVGRSDAMTRRLHAVLGRFDPAMPEALGRTLTEITDLATERGIDHIVKVVGGLRELRLPRMTPENVALALFLQRPDAFEAAVARTHSSELRFYSEYYATSNRPLPKSAMTWRRFRLRTLLKHQFEQRGRRAPREIPVVRDGAETTFVIAHAYASVPFAFVDSTEVVKRFAVAHDLVVFDACCGRLSVNAECDKERELYRAAFGRVLFGDERHFAAPPVFTGEPLLLEGPAALAAHGLSDITEVELTHVSVAFADGGNTLRWAGPSLRRELESPLGRLFLAQGEVTGLGLELTVKGWRRPLTVELVMPNTIRLDRRIGSELVREFLRRTNLMRGRPSESDPQSPDSAGGDPPSLAA